MPLTLKGSNAAVQFACCSTCVQCKKMHHATQVLGGSVVPQYVRVTMVTGLRPGRARTARAGHAR